MKRKLICLYITLIAITLPANAQKFLNDALTLSNVSLWQQGKSLYIGMTFDMRNVIVDTDRSLSLIPLLTDGLHNVPLQEIIVNGKRREKAFIRGLVMTRQELNAIIVPYDKRETFNYTQVISYKPWMANASLQLVENLCGCGNFLEMNARELITNNVSTEIKRLSAMSPVVAYIQPTIEIIKNRNSDVGQGRIIIRENPKFLSLSEMYQVAISYPKGSKDFVDVFDIAVRMYPNDEVANLNAAAVALSQKDLNAALKYMEKADHTTAEFLNNTGVYNFLNGDIQRAVAAFEQAARLGNEAALSNFRQLHQIMNMKINKN